MMSDNIFPDTLPAIAQARSLSGQAAGGCFTPSRNLGAVLAERVKACPDKNWLTFCDEEGQKTAYTYGEFFHTARCAAAFMHETLGLQTGDRVATLLVNDPRTVLIYFGAWLLGVTVVPINMGEDDERVEFILRHSEVRAAFALDEQVGRCLPCLASVVSLTEFDKALAAQSPREALPDLPPETEALIVYTSGTTGAPKGVVLEQGNLLADAQSIAEWHRFGPEDRALCVLPLHHVNGTVVTLVTPLLSGGSVVLSRRFHAQSFWQTLAEERCTWVSVVPTVLAFLCERGKEAPPPHPNKAQFWGAGGEPTRVETHYANPVPPLLGAGGLPAAYDLSAFRHFVCGAGPLTTELAAHFHRQSGLRVVHGYGLSETTCYSCFLPIDLDERTYLSWMTERGFPSIGCPIAANEVAIHDAEGNSLGENVRGEIVVRGLNVMRGYFGRPEANRDAFAHGWFRSGDEGYFQRGADGRPYFFITGRLKELIIRGGVNYSPFDIDEVLNGIAGIKAAMAVGFENHFYGEEVGAYVQLDDGAALTETDILAQCREKLPFAKSPKVVIFGDTFPVTSTGKYQRLKLRPLFAAWKSAEFRDERRAR